GFGWPVIPKMLPDNPNASAAGSFAYSHGGRGVRRDPGPPVVAPQRACRSSLRRSAGVSHRGRVGPPSTPREAKGLATHGDGVRADAPPSLESQPVKNDLVVVAGAGGFIGGHLVDSLLKNGHTRVRAVDQKPLDSWWQRHPGVENLVLDLKDRKNCRTALDGAHTVYNLAADMGGMGFIENNKAL